MRYGQPVSEGDIELEALISPDRTFHTDLQQAIGRIAWASAELEETLRLFFYRLIFDDSAFAVADGETADWLVQKCLRLLGEEHMSADSRQNSHDHIKPTLRRAKVLFEERGAIVHATWAKLEDGRCLARRTRRFKIVSEVGFEIEDLHRLADDLLQARDHISKDQTYGL